MTEERYRWCKSWGIATQNRDVCVRMIEEVVNSCGKKVTGRYISERGISIFFDDDTVLRWIDPENPARAVRFGKLWVDKSMDRNYFQTIIAPTFRGANENLIWFDGEKIDMNLIYEMGTHEMTVGELSELLARFPKEYSVSLCGINSCAALVDFKKNTILFDDKDWVTEYAEEVFGGEICTEQLR